ncbi:CPBP family glutamic-type intramembrane protease [Ornithobacterium rhinotracheale]|uniref:CPBP family glutamic-type intramembrane protease n=1 Tax=Ornithobacterium rhinotracheale TaxID=28251 RepID=UPI003FA4CC3E
MIVLFSIAFFIKVIFAITGSLFELLPNSRFNNLSPFLLLFLSLIAAITEEYAFRGLFILKKRNIFLSFSILSYYIFNSFVFKTSNFDTSNHFILRITLSLLSGGFFLYLYSIKENIFLSFWKKHFSFIFYTSSLIFAFAHLKNYHDLNWALPVFIILPKFISALLLGYIRVRYGLIYSIALHSINNATPFLFLILSQKI